jgi:hypothetical protein
MVDPPGEEDAISILRGIKERFEKYHNVHIRDEALVNAVVLSSRYIQDRFLPDKAIDLLDEACARIRTEMDSCPQELDELSRLVRRLEIEEIALKKEKDPSSKKRLEELQSELVGLKKRVKEMTVKWQNEKSALEDLKKVRTSLEEEKNRYETALMRGDNETAARLKYGIIPELEKKLKSHEEDLLRNGGDALLREEVTAEEIAEVVSRWSGIPVAKLVEGEREKLVRLSDILHERVIGQDKAVDAVADETMCYYEFNNLLENNTYYYSIQSSDITKACEEHVSEATEPVAVTTTLASSGNDKDENQLPIAVDSINYDVPTHVVYLSNPRSGGKLSIYNAQGMLVYSCPTFDGVTEYIIPVEQLQKGTIYFIKYIENGKMRRKQGRAKFVLL